ncbi:MAG: RNA methyltransferase [Litorilinea sp.]
MITSITNLRIKDARKLQRRRQRHRDGLLLIEGVRLVGDAVAAGMRPLQVFYAPDLLTSAAGQQLVTDLTQAGVETLACSTTVFASLTETVTPQGLAAVIPMPHLARPAAPDLVLILDQVREPGNAGTLLRSAEAAGVDVVLCAPETVDPYNDKALRAGMGAHFRVPLHICQQWATVTEYLGTGDSGTGYSSGTDSRRGDPDPEANSPAARGALRYYLADANARQAYDEVDWTLPAALIIGGEAEGASMQARALATPLAIPMLGRTESLNAAVAGAVILFEAARQRRRAKVVR